MFYLIDNNIVHKKLDKTLTKITQYFTNNNKKMFS